MVDERETRGGDNWDEFDSDYDLDEPEDDDISDECGRLWGGRMAPWSDCTKAGSEFCDFECPYGRAGRATLDQRGEP